jgi:hypothetical protein
MSRLGVFFLSCFWVGLLPHASLGAAAGKPDFQEIYSVIASNPPPGISRSALNDLAVTNLLSALGPRVSLLPSGETPDATPSARDGTQSISRSEVFEGSLAYFRIREVQPGLSSALVENFKRFAGTNKIQGIVLDLRYCAGSSYEEVVAVADLFLSSEKPLLDWGEGMVSTKDRSVPINVPAAVLVNRETAGAAEALAAALRQTGAGLVLGSRTAGLAAAGREFELSNGQRLRINLRPILLGNGAAVPSTGVEPDIAVAVPSDEERAYFADAFAVVTRTNGVDGTSRLIVEAGGTNRAARKPRFNEADLVREHTEGRMDPTRRAETEPEMRIVNDPVLARALDVLKGLAVVRQRR